MLAFNEKPFILSLFYVINENQVSDLEYIRATAQPHNSAELSNHLLPHEKVSRFLQESIWTQVSIFQSTVHSLP